jgi:hypothetical protein
MVLLMVMIMLPVATALELLREVVKLHRLVWLRDRTS